MGQIYKQIVFKKCNSVIFFAAVGVLANCFAAVGILANCNGLPQLASSPTVTAE